MLFSFTLLNSNLVWTQDAIQPEFRGDLTLRIEGFGIDKGLSKGLIFDSAVDDNCYLWVATKEGLNRFDGYNFKVFRCDPKKPGSISENLCTAVYHDGKGRIWSSAYGKSLELFIPETESFRHFTFNSAASGSISSEIQNELPRKRKLLCWREFVMVITYKTLNLSSHFDKFHYVLQSLTKFY